MQSRNREESPTADQGVAKTLPQKMSWMLTGRRLVYALIVVSVLIFLTELIHAAAFRSWFFANEKVNIPTILVVVSSLIFALTESMESEFTAKADEFFQALCPDQPASADELKMNVKGADDLQVERLIKQLVYIDKRKRSHFKVMKYFYVRYYVATQMFSILGVLSAGILVYIGKDGYDKVPHLLMAVFLLFSSASAYFGTFPTVFKMQENITKNRDLYTEYENLEDELISYGITGENVKTEKKLPNEFIHYVDGQMGKLNQVAVEFDYTKVPVWRNKLKSLDQ
jgi:ABC-type transport system involved in cytochrome bd biosynthesis fused ATPase/permease subunit